MLHLCPVTNCLRATNRYAKGSRGRFRISSSIGTASQGYKGRRGGSEQITRWHRCSRMPDRPYPVGQASDDWHRNSAHCQTAFRPIGAAAVLRYTSESGIVIKKHEELTDRSLFDSVADERTYSTHLSAACGHVVVGPASQRQPRGRHFDCHHNVDQRHHGLKRWRDERTG